MQYHMYVEIELLIKKKKCSLKMKKGKKWLSAKQFQSKLSKIRKFLGSWNSQFCYVTHSPLCIKSWNSRGQPPAALASTKLRPRFGFLFHFNSLVVMRNEVWKGQKGLDVFFWNKVLLRRQFVRNLPAPCGRHKRFWFDLWGRKPPWRSE